MARTWPVTRAKLLALGAVDALGRSVTALVRRRSSHATAPVSRILVLELWHMGDVVLATAALRRLRGIYPGASITLLAKAHAVDLLAESGLADEIVPYDFPWTAPARKYDPSRYDAGGMRSLVRRLRSQRFDLSVDCRMDIRSNMLTRAIGARRRVGYDFGGGGFLLTDAAPPPPADQHKVEDWMALLDPLAAEAGTGLAPTEPLLVVTEAEQAEARRVLQSYGFAEIDTVVAIHPGGSLEAKRWPVDNFAQVAKALAERNSVRLLVFVDPEGVGSDMQAGGDAAYVRTSIREMMALLTQCDLLICNDSGPMHMAAALGVPVVAVFRTGDPAAYGPRGLNHEIAGTGSVHGRAEEVAIDDVLALAEAQLARIAGPGTRGPAA